MILVRRVLLVTSLVCLLATTAVFGLNVQASWAVNSFIQQPIIMELEGKVKGVAKEIEGKAQETYGNITGSQKDQIAGKAKQYQGQATQNAEDAKENLSDVTENTGEKVQGFSQKVQGKAQETYGNITGGQKDQMVGKVKQYQGEAVQGSFQDKFQEFFDNLLGKKS